jgi:hypothetical protein
MLCEAVYDLVYASVAREYNDSVVVEIHLFSKLGHVTTMSCDYSKPVSARLPDWVYAENILVISTVHLAASKIALTSPSYIVRPFPYEYQKDII